MSTAFLGSISILGTMKTLVYMLILALSIEIGISDCSKNKTVNRPDEDTSADLFFDLAQATQQHAADTTALRQRHEALLQAYPISPAELEQVLKGYEQHPEKWIQLLQKMSDKQREEKNEKKKKAARSNRLLSESIGIHKNTVDNLFRVFRVFRGLLEIKRGREIRMITEAIEGYRSGLHTSSTIPTEPTQPTGSLPSAWRITAIS